MNEDGVSTKKIIRVQNPTCCDRSTTHLRVRPCIGLKSGPFMLMFFFFLQRLHHDDSCASVSQVCVMSLSLSLSAAAPGRRLHPFHPRRDQQPTLRLMEVALFIIAGGLELAADVRHIVQEQPPVCEVHQSYAANRSPHRQGRNPGLDDGHVLRADQFADLPDHFVWMNI